MDRALGLFVIGLVFGGGVGFIAAASQGVTLDGHDHANAAHHGEADHAMMHDQPLEVAADTAPRVAIEMTRDPMSGHNLRLKTQNFEFAPEAASEAHVAGQGHAHLYLDGQKFGRLYGEWLHLPALPSGDIEIKVTLNANDHRVYSVDGVPVSALLNVTIE